MHRAKRTNITVIDPPLVMADHSSSSIKVHNALPLHLDSHPTKPP